MEITRELPINGIRALRTSAVQDYEVAYTLASLAGFGRGTIVRHFEPGIEPESRRTVIVFHPETVAEFRDCPSELLFAGSPDILVSKLLGNRFHFGLNEERVDPEVIDKLPAELAKVYRDTSIKGRFLHVLESLTYKGPNAEELAVISLENRPPWFPLI